MLTTIYLDFETNNATVDLEDAGARTYAEHEGTMILCLSYAIGDGPVELLTDPQGVFDGLEDEDQGIDPDEGDAREPFPDDLFCAIDDGYRVVAHNFQFDRAIYQEQLVPAGWPEIPIEQWDCTQFRARLARLPAALEEAAKALRLPHQKDQAGHRLMKALARRNLMRQATTDEERENLYRYCKIDTETLRDLDLALPPMPDEWRPIFELDCAMNDAGMPVDLAAVAKLITVRDAENLRLAQEFRELAGEGDLTSPKQIAKFKVKLASLGVELANLQRETLEDWQDENPARDDLAAKLVRNRLESSHSSDAKLDRIVATATGTGRVRGGFILHGAHPGRWSGQGVQLQNLPKNRVADSEATLTALLGRADGIAAGTVDPMAVPGWSVSIKEAISGCLRSLFRAPEGWVFVSADLGQIESRVLCWISGQDDKLDMYRRGEDVYTAEAKGLDSGSRDLGKLFVLSAGYGASSRVIHSRAPGYGVTLTPDEASEKTARWRENNGAIVAFWYALFDQLKLCLELPAGQGPIEFRCFRIWRTEAMLFIQLPSGRCLKYHNPQLTLDDERGTLVLKVELPKSKKLLSSLLWHGAATENVTQAIAADILIHGMLQLHADGIFLIGCIHDEIVALAPAEHAEEIRDHMVAVMKTAPGWAPDLPLAADAFINQRFVKPVESAHAPLPPSSAERWLNCPGSVAAERTLGPMEVESTFALEGTEAHRIFAACLERNLDPAELTEDPLMLIPLRHALLIARNVIAGRRFKVEIRLEPLPGIGKVWGTADVLVFDEHDRLVAVLDLKFGAGVTVEPTSPQLAIYGLLGTQQFGGHPDGIALHILQPRRQHVQGPHRWRHMPTDEMDRLFADLQQAVEAAEDPAAPRIAGEWCRFCAARSDCPEAPLAKARPHAATVFTSFAGGGN
jgi:DNA polymerase